MALAPEFHTDTGTAAFINIRHRHHYRRQRPATSIRPRKTKKQTNRLIGARATSSLWENELLIVTSSEDDMPPAGVTAPDGAAMNKAYFLVLPRVHMLDLAGPLQIMGTLAELGISDVDIQCIGPEPNVDTFQRVMLGRVAPLPERLEPDDVVFVIGSKLNAGLMASPAWQSSAAWLKDKISTTKPPPNVAGICTGTFLLGEAGLLDGRLCTTHHQFVPQLRRKYPAAQVVDNRICVQEGRLWTSAGVASGIDLALQLIARNFGDHIALQVARENVVHFRRFGNDPELGVKFRYRTHGNQIVHAMQDEISNNLSRAWTCEELAKKAGFSSRHLARLFKAETGVTMKRYQVELRMDLARRLINDSTLSLERIAERCGFSSMQAFRANWNKYETVPPSRMRQHPRKELD